MGRVIRMWSLRPVAGAVLVILLVGLATGLFLSRGDSDDDALTPVAPTPSTPAAATPTPSTPAAATPTPTPTPHADAHADTHADGDGDGDAHAGADPLLRS